VLLIGFEWFQMADTTTANTLNIPKDTRPATKKELLGMFEQLEAELDDCGFFHVREKRPIMSRNIRNIFQRAAMTEQEIRTFRGVIAGLGKKRKKP
jgi:tRNA/rRNA methyltransferase